MMPNDGMDDGGGMSGASKYSIGEAEEKRTTELLRTEGDGFVRRARTQVVSVLLLVFN